VVKEIRKGGEIFFALLRKLFHYLNPLQREGEEAVRRKHGKKSFFIYRRGGGPLPTLSKGDSHGVLGIKKGFLRQKKRSRFYETNFGSQRRGEIGTGTRPYLRFVQQREAA